VIVGAGPAGLSTALHLIQADPSWTERMLVLEKEAHPRHKLCGGGVTRLGLEALRELGFELPLPLPQARVDEVHLNYRRHVIHVRGRSQFVVFHRQEFDAYLADQARQRGVFIRQREPVERFSVDAQGVNLETSQAHYRARALVGADGSKGVVRRTLKKRFPTSRVARLLEVTHPACESQELFTGHMAWFDFTPAGEGLQGYFWDFPSWVDGAPTHNLGLYDSRKAHNRPRADLPGILDASLRSLSFDPGAMHLMGHPIHRFSPRNLFARPRLILVGDAAGADPLFGEGIAPALLYGKLASESVQASFVSGDFSFGGYRGRVLRSRLGRYLLIRWMVAWWGYRFSHYPAFMRPLWLFGRLLARAWPDPPEMR
jgi:flavin-dependent dehydrogenase